ncbi:MAG TPA: hypothetical protein VJ879_02510 [Desulfobacter sp.]|nr:hypothetical protein [Desulfobacter sp.]
MHRKLRVLPWEVSHVPRDVACDRNWLRAEQSALTAWEKSAEGIVGEGRLNCRDWKRAPRIGEGSPH